MPPASPHTLVASLCVVSIPLPSFSFCRLPPPSLRSSFHSSSFHLFVALSQEPLWPSGRLRVEQKWSSIGRCSDRIHELPAVSAPHNGNCSNTPIGHSPPPLLPLRPLSDGKSVDPFASFEEGAQLEPQSARSLDGIRCTLELQSEKEAMCANLWSDHHSY